MISYLTNNKLLIARRFTQILVMVLFWISLRFDIKIAGIEILEGNLSASSLLGFIPLADPYAALQILFAGQSLASDVLIGAAVILLIYFVVGGRSFCSWVCPMNIVTDLAHKIRQKVKLPNLFHLPRKTRYGFLALSLILSVYTGVAAFEWISPVSMMQRGLIYGMGAGWLVIGAIFLGDLFAQRGLWCGHLCPLGAFYGLLGKYSLLKVGFVKETCTKCGECHHVCPEPQVLNLNLLFEKQRVNSGDCTNCGKCISECPENSFYFSFKKQPY